MFPDFDRKALNSILRGNGNIYTYLYLTLDNKLNATIDYLLSLTEEQ
jgi:hypothetical protein